MPDKKPELSDAMKKKLEPKESSLKTRFLEQNLPLQFQAQKVVLENPLLQRILLWH